MADWSLFPPGGAATDCDYVEGVRVVPHAHHQELHRRPEDQDRGAHGQATEHEALWVRPTSFTSSRWRPAYEAKRAADTRLVVFPELCSLENI